MYTYSLTRPLLYCTIVSYIYFKGWIIMSENNKSTYTPARAKSQKKYLTKNFDDIKIRVPKGKRDYYKQAAENAGESLNSFAIRAMEYLIELEKLNDKK